MLHGPRGEDGTIQGIFELMNIPYVGCGVSSSAICMDKVFAKMILRQEGLPVVDYKVYHKDDLSLALPDIIAEIESSFGVSVFCKTCKYGFKCWYIQSA